MMRSFALVIACGLAPILSLGIGAPAQAQNNAQFVSQSVPSLMTPGQSYAVSVTMKNTGTSTWTPETFYRLGSQNPQDNTTWGTNRVYMPGGSSVAPGANATFNFNVTAPTNAGLYNFQWKMLREGVQWFGALSANVAVAVGEVDHAQYVSQSVPASMTASQSYAVSVTMKNAGGTTWSPGEYYLRSQNPEDNTNWGLNRVELPGAVAPGENVTFNFNASSPVNGTVNFRWRMARATASFGDLTPNVAVSVSGSNNAQFVSQSVPAVMTAGQTYAVSVTMNNTGTTTWSAANGYKLGSQNPQDNFTWSVWRIATPGAVAPGQNATFSFNVIAPATPGTYNFQWKMLREGFQWFGALSTNVAVVVGAPNAAFVTQNVPASMVQGFAYPASVTMQNSGNLTWSPGQHYLRSQNPQDNTNWGLNRVELPSAVAPGQSVTFNFNAAPSLSGNMNFQWRMADSAASFGELSPNVAVAVSGPDNAQFVSQVVPSSLAPGQTQLVSVTMQNTGSTTWSAAQGYRLGSQNPQDNTTWGYRVSPPQDVPPGEGVTFTFAVTAPASPGTYDFQWKMLREGADWFGALTTNVAISVQASQGAGVHYIHTDHLNTPRLVADATGTTVWKWDQQEPFGNNPADENPSGLGTFDLPLRLPGQYADKETNLHYNYFRDCYDPAIGRYCQSDPIGLAGGLNTYLYVAADPLFWSDPQGLNIYTSGGTICPNPRNCPNPPYDPTGNGPKPSPQTPKPPKNPAAPKSKPGDPEFCAETQATWVTCIACCQGQAQRSLIGAFTGSFCRDKCSRRDPPYPDAPYQTQAPLICRPT